MTDKDNYRGIYLLPVLSKVYEQLLLDWFDATLTLPNRLQGAAHQGFSSLHSTMLLSEVINHNITNGSSVYVTLLDVGKAFGITVYFTNCIH